MESQKSFIERAAAGALVRKEVDAFCVQHGLNAADFFNSLSIDIAKGFDSGELDFWPANHAMNHIFSFLLEDFALVGDGYEFPEPAFSIYEAFDAGEWDRGDGRDPVITYTAPEIKRILSTA